MVDKTGRVRVRDWNGDIAGKKELNKNHDIIQSGIRANPNFKTCTLPPPFGHLLS